MLEALWGFADRFGNGDIDVIDRVIPFDGKPAVLSAMWVESDGIILPERVKEVGGVIVGEELDT